MVRYLREPVLGGLRRAVGDCVPRQCALDREVEGLGDGVLAVVVVDLDRVVALQLREVVEQKVHKVSASFSSEGPVWSRMTTVSR